MGCVCCRRRTCEEGQPSWHEYSDRTDEFVIPSTAWQRRNRPGTRSMTSGELQEYASDEAHPRRQAAAAKELSRRRGK